MRLLPCRSFEIKLGEAPTVVALASVRNIVVGEELCIDYNPGHADPEMYEAHMANGQRKVQCLCGAARCRKWVF